MKNQESPFDTLYYPINQNDISKLLQKPEFLSYLKEKVHSSYRRRNIEPNEIYQEVCYELLSSHGFKELQEVNDCIRKTIQNWSMRAYRSRRRFSSYDICTQQDCDQQTELNQTTRHSFQNWVEDCQINQKTENLKARVSAIEESKNDLLNKKALQVMNGLISLKNKELSSTSIYSKRYNQAEIAHEAKTTQTTVSRQLKTIKKSFLNCPTQSI